MSKISGMWSLSANQPSDPLIGDRPVAQECEVNAMPETEVPVVLGDDG